MLLQTHNPGPRTPWAHSAREVAELVAAKLREQGFQVDPAYIDQVTKAVETGVTRYKSAKQVEAYAEDQMAPMMASIEEVLRMLAPDLTNGK